MSSTDVLCYNRSVSPRSGVGGGVDWVGVRFVVWLFGDGWVDEKFVFFETFLLVSLRNAGRKVRE